MSNYSTEHNSYVSRSYDKDSVMSDGAKQIVIIVCFFWAILFAVVVPYFFNP